MKYVKSDDQYQVGTASLPALQDLADIKTLTKILGVPQKERIDRPLFSSSDLDVLRRILGAPRTS